MTVKELIEALQGYNDPDAVVCLWPNSDDCYNENLPTEVTHVCSYGNVEYLDKNYDLMEKQHIISLHDG